MLSEEDRPRDYPIGLDFPFQWTGDPVGFFQGKASLSNSTRTVEGIANVTFDTRQRPIWNFEFVLGHVTSDFEVLKESFSGDLIGEALLSFAEIDCVLRVHVNRQSKSLRGVVVGREVVATVNRRFATYGVLNGPEIHGQPVRRNGGFASDRLSATCEAFCVTMDRVRIVPYDSVDQYLPTHVVQVEFLDESTAETRKLAQNCLFWTLSVMKCRWVGLIGPWLHNGEIADSILMPGITKSIRRMSGRSWCFDQISDSFEKLFPLVYETLTNSKKRESSITAMHWLVESSQCAGGVEGSLILQQCALECLSWSEMVVSKKLYSNSKFDKLSAEAKIRSFCDHFQISNSIPNKCTDIQAYADQHGKKDLIDVLVSVRNALVHAEPKKVASLFDRDQGDDERSELWYQIGGLLQQGILATLGYSGGFLNRALDSEYAAGAVVPVPWSDEQTSTP